MKQARIPSRKCRHGLAPAATMIGLLLPAASMAQSISAASAPARANRPPVSAPEEIIVTAQRRSENLKDVPVSVTVVSQSQMAAQGISSTQDLTKIVPGLNMSIEGSYVRPVLRGVSSLSIGLGNDSAVPIYFDGLYLSLPGANFFNFADVADVQVLKGPQGTLYGRNSTGGAILISTRAPSFSPEGEMSLSYASYNDLKASGFATTGIIPDLLAASLSGFYERSDGFVHNVATGGRVGNIRNYAVRGKLLFTPFTGARITLSAFATRDNDDSIYGQFAVDQNSLSRLVDPTAPITNKPYQTSAGSPQQLFSKTRGTSLSSVFDTDIGTITSLTGYQYGRGAVQDDADAGPAFALQINQFQRSKTLSEDLTLASRDFGPLSFIAGVLYYHQRAIDNLRVNSAQNIDGLDLIEAYATYLQVQLRLTDRLKLIAGARYSDETRRYSGGFSIGAGVPTTNVINDAHADFSQVTPRATIQYDVTDHANVYASFNRGFKSGLFNSTGLSSVPVKPTNIRAFEIGAKGAWHNLSINIALYDDKLTNLQVQSIVTAPDGTTTSLFQNAGAAISRGIDIDGSVRFSRNVQLSGGFAYNHNKFTSFPDANVNIPFPSSVCAAAGAPYPCGDTAAGIDATGKPVPRAPKFTVNVTAAYTTVLAGGDLNLSATFYHNSGFSWEVANRLRQGSYNTLAAQVSWSPAKSGLQFAVFGTNLTNELYAINEVDSAGGDTITFAEPRAVGGRITYRF